MGEWKDSKRFTGNGIIKFDNGGIWEGEWSEGVKINGKGTITYPDNSKYVGAVSYTHLTLPTICSV